MNASFRLRYQKLSDARCPDIFSLAQTKSEDFSDA
jgi:hypothetical protein